jgi:hypothetical protein
MIPIQLNEQTYYFSIIHITKQLPDKLIYGILINSENYYINKSFGVNDCGRLDSHPLLTQTLLFEICEILTRLEIRHQHYPELETINQEIANELAINRVPTSTKHF